MKVYIKAMSMLLAMCLISSIAFAESLPDNWDAKAVEVFKQMDAYTDSLQKFIITTDSYSDASIGPGMIISNPFTTRIAVQRPGSLHSVTKGGSHTSEIYMDKGRLTVYSGDKKLYTHADVPEPMSKGLLYALEEFAVETPLLDLLILKSLDRLLSGDEIVAYVSGDSQIRGVDCHHILVSGPLADLQVWIAKGDKPVPKRTLLRYKHGEGMPRHDVFIDWAITDGFDKSEFKFVPPEGAQEIDFINTP
jgi:hypothetical protein